MKVKHSKVSSIPDGTDSGLVQPSDWNEEHVIEGAPPITPNTAPSTPQNENDEFEGTSLDTAGTRRAGAIPWSWVNQGSAAANLSGGSLVLSNQGQSSDNVRAVVQAVSGTSWRYRAALGDSRSVGTSGVAVAGVVVRNSSTGKILLNYVARRTSTSTGSAIGLQRWDSPTAFSANVGSELAFPGWARFIEVELALGTLYFRASDTGEDGTFMLLWQEDVSAFLGSANQIGLFLNNTNSFAQWVVVPWFRRIA